MCREVELAAYTDERGAERISAVFGSVVAVPVEPGWADGWRAFHHGVRAGGLWIGPPWEAALPGEPAVVIEPGLAFGTGGHGTTRGCIELLARAARGSFLDAGCGSGVVAIAAARLGFVPVHALDDDPVSVAVARENALRNGVPVEVRRANVLSDVLPAVDVVVANIELASVEVLLERVPAAIVIASGYDLEKSPAAPGWRHEERLEVEGWAADLFARMG